VRSFIGPKQLNRPLLLEYFGEQGERWTRDRYDDGDGRRCLVGALRHLRGKHRVPSESAECFLQEAMKQGLPHRRGGLVYFNDRCRSFAEFRAVIVEARALNSAVASDPAATDHRPRQDHLRRAQLSRAVQGFAQEEDVAFKKLLADYQKASGNKIEDSIIPFAPMRQKAVSAITSGVVPDVMELADFSFLPLNAWADKLVDVSDIVEPLKSQYIDTALRATYYYTYNNVTKKRAYYAVPMKAAGIPFHIWQSLVEKAGFKISDIPNTWDAFLDFFMPVQDKLRAQGMRNIYAYGYQLTANGVDPAITFQGFLMAYGGKNLVTPDGKLHTDDPQVKDAAVKAIAKLTTPFKQGYAFEAVPGRALRRPAAHVACGVRVQFSRTTTS
jgi:maltose-binding protein MalE